MSKSLALEVDLAISTPCLSKFEVEGSGCFVTTKVTSSATCLVDA